MSLNCPAPPSGTSSTVPEVIRQVLPQYSEAAKIARISGTVIMQGLVSEDGSFSVTRFIQTVGFGLDENAQGAVEQWRFCPATRNGVPTATSLTVGVTFTIL